MTDPREIENVLRLVDREIWIVTAGCGDGSRGGLCATWVSSASIDVDRPLMLAGLAPNHFTAELVERSGAFALHLLRPDQASLALHFALGSGRDRDKLAGLEQSSGLGGAPLLRDCLAWFDCRVFARYDAGDRIFYWADVLAAEKRSGGSPLRERELIAAAASDQLSRLRADRESDVRLQRPLHEFWRKSTPFSISPPRT